MPSERQNGIVIGIVDDLRDPENIGRVRVRYPHLNNQLSEWARLVSLMAGGKRGTFFRPEKNDEVLVAFEQGDPNRPYILGGLWSKPDAPPPDDGKPADNNWRQIKSRSGHILRFDDTSGKEKIEILDKDNQRTLVIDASGQKIQITCKPGDVEISAPTGTVKVEAQSVSVKATADMNLEATGVMTIKGATVNIN